MRGRRRGRGGVEGEKGDEVVGGGVRGAGYSAVVGYGSMTGFGEAILHTVWSRLVYFCCQGIYIYIITIIFSNFISICFEMTLLNHYLSSSKPLLPSLWALSSKVACFAFI